MGMLDRRVDVLCNQEDVWRSGKSEKETEHDSGVAPESVIVQHVCCSIMVAGRLLEGMELSGFVRQSNSSSQF